MRRQHYLWYTYGTGQWDRMDVPCNPELFFPGKATKKASLCTLLPKNYLEEA